MLGLRLMESMIRTLQMQLVLLMKAPVLQLLLRERKLVRMMTWMLNLMLSLPDLVLKIKLPLPQLLHLLAFLLAGNLGLMLNGTNSLVLRSESNLNQSEDSRELFEDIQLRRDQEKSNGEDSYLLK